MNKSATNHNQIFIFILNIYTVNGARFMSLDIFENEQIRVSLHESTRSHWTNNIFEPA